MDEVLARLFAVADDVNAGVLLKFEREKRGVVLGLRQFVAIEPSWRPQPVRLGKPGRFWQTFGDGGGKQAG